MAKRWILHSVLRWISLLWTCDSSQQFNAILRHWYVGHLSMNGGDIVVRYSWVNWSRLKTVGSTDETINAINFSFRAHREQMPWQSVKVSTGSSSHECTLWLRSLKKANNEDYKSLLNTSSVWKWEQNLASSAWVDCWQDKNWTMRYHSNEIAI